MEKRRFYCTPVMRAVRLRSACLLADIYSASMARTLRTRLPNQHLPESYLRYSCRQYPSHRVPLSTTHLCNPSAVSGCQREVSSYRRRYATSHVGNVRNRQCDSWEDQCYKELYL